MKATNSGKSVDFCVDVTLDKGTHFETSCYLDYKLFLNPQTHFSTASCFAYAIPLKA